MDRHRKQQAQTMEFSKKTLIITSILFSASIIYTMVVCAKGYVDTTAIITLLTTTGGCFSANIIFYLNKARFENVTKIKKSFLREKYDILHEIGALDARAEILSEVQNFDYHLENEEINTNSEQFGM